MGKAITEEVLRRMEEEAVYEMLHYHEKTGKQKIKDTVKRAAGRYVAPKDLIFWPTAMIANCLTEWETGGVLMDGKRSGNKKALSAVKAYFDRWIDAGMPIFYIDDTLAGVSLVDLYAATGEEKYKAGADKMAEYLFRLGREEADENGSIPYRPSQKNGYIFADGVGMACSFLVKYGTAFDNVHSVELGLLQMRNMFLFGMDEKTGLPYHGFQYGKNAGSNRACGTKYGIIGWGRAVGWLLMGLARSLGNLEKCRAEEKNGDLADMCRAGYEECRREYWQLLAAAAPYQKENGAFTWQLQALEGPEDSSATAMIAYAVLMGMQCGQTGTGPMDKKEDANGNGHRGCGAWKGAEELEGRAAAYLAGCEKDGKIYHCLAECMGFAEYPQVYGAYPWSLGPGLGVLRKKGV